MAEYWRDGRAMGVPAPAKRPRNDMPPGREIPGYLPEMPGRMNTNPTGAMDPHMRNGMPPYSTGAMPGNDMNNMGATMGPRIGGPGAYGGIPGSSPVDPMMMNQRPPMPNMDSGMPKVGGMPQGFIRTDAQPMREPPMRRPEEYLPPDASNTLFVEGLPADCTRREAAHIFRPFVGFKEVRLVQKEPRRPGGDPLVLCFVDFSETRFAATALEALQGYKFDENDRESSSLRLQYARFPGPRSGAGRDDSFRGGRDDARMRGPLRR